MKKRITIHARWDLEEQLMVAGATTAELEKARAIDAAVYRKVHEISNLKIEARKLLEKVR